MSDCLTVQSGSSAVIELESAEQYKARCRYSRQQAKQKCVQAELDRELNSNKTQYIDKYDNAIKDITFAKTGIEAETQSDGSSKLKEKTGGGFWNKLKRWGGNLVSTVTNIGKSLIGIDEENGKWRPLNFIKNAAIVGACFIPYVGPVIGLGLCGYGLYKGAPSLVEGIKELNKPKSDEQLDHAQQKVLGSAITVLLSAFGVRGIGKGFRTNPATSAKASSATARTGAGKVIEGTSNFVRDITYNAVKGTFYEAGRGLQAFKALPALRRGYTNKVRVSERPLAREISELEAKISSETNPTYRAFYEEQLEFVRMKHGELHSVENLTQVQLRRLSSENAVTKIENRMAEYVEKDGMIVFKRNGKKYKIDKNDPVYKDFNKSISKSNKSYNKSLEEVIRAREQIMAKYAKKPDKYQTELDNYTQMSIRNKYATPEALEQGMTALETRISAAESKIIEIEGKLTTASAKAAKKLRNQLKGVKKVEASLQEELALCKSIKLKKWYRPSTWRKNKYELAMSGVKAPGFGYVLRNKFVSSGMASGLATSATQFDPIYTDACGYSTTLTPEQTTQILDVMKQYADAFRIARQSLLDAEDDEQIEQLSQAFDVLNNKYHQEINYIITGETPVETADAQSSGNQSSEEQSTGEQKPEENPSENELRQNS